ncbi:hypothetical protein C810_01994 [Lachnospiraceae bacterium A2]|nr:hypothetical protein C810_01994 [Lachnospiraceae bacterium A2]
MKQIQYIWKNAALKICNSRALAFAVIIFVVCRGYCGPVNRFMDAADYPVSWCVFPFFMGTNSFLILFWFLMVYLHSDVPFMQHANMYQVIRAGRVGWAVGQVGGIFLRSFAAVLFTALCTILPLLPRIELANEWGKLLRTVAMTNAGTEYGFKFAVYYQIFSEYTPLQLMGISILLCTFISGFLGTLMFFISLYSNKVLGVAGALAMAILMFFVINMHPKIRYKMAFFVPSVWAQVARSATPELGYYWLPSVPYMFGFLTVGTGLMVAFILHKVKRVEFNWENDDV